jgi:hypothetical protein
MIFWTNKQIRFFDNIPLHNLKGQSYQMLGVKLCSMKVNLYTLSMTSYSLQILLFSSQDIKIYVERALMKMHNNSVYFLKSH